MILKMYHDPGHGWLAVKGKTLIDFDIFDKISNYSFTNGKTVYLEEDLDASIFIKELEKRQIPFQIKHIHSNKKSKIRNYKNFLKSKSLFLLFSGHKTVNLSLSNLSPNELIGFPELK